MEIKAVKSIPKIRKVSKFDPTIEEVAKRISKDPTQTLEVSDVDSLSGLVGRFRARKKEGEFESVFVKPRGHAVYFSAVEA